MNRVDLVNYNIYAIGGGQLTYNNNILTINITMDKISSDR